MNSRPQSPKILVVEDNEADVQLLREALRKHEVQAELHVVQDGELAIQYIKSRDQAESAEKPNLVLLDLNLPKRGGMEVLEYIRRKDAFRKVPVIVYTSSASLAERKQSKRLGADMFFQKTFELDEYFKIGEHIKRALEKPEGPADAGSFED